MARARLALDGLSLGDAFGERFFGPPDIAIRSIAARSVPAAPWGTTDDTAMGLSIVEVLGACGRIDQDLLAAAFARRYQADPRRGYGGTAHEILSAIGNGEPWRAVASAAFDGQGSMGNGAAMRVAPVGAYFADDVARVIAEARASAEVTHAHPDGQAGAIAVALAAAWACVPGAATRDGQELLDFVIAHTPEGDTRGGLARARALPPHASVTRAAAALGTGRAVIASDTVPFALWCAARQLGDFVEAMWTTVEGLGDRDTTCAIAGGVVALAAGRDALPAAWMAVREPLAGG